MSPLLTDGVWAALLRDESSFGCARPHERRRADATFGKLAALISHTEVRLQRRKFEIFGADT